MMKIRIQAIQRIGDLSINCQKKKKRKTQTVKDASATSGFAITTGISKADTIRNDIFSSIIITAASARVATSRVHFHRP